MLVPRYSLGRRDIIEGLLPSLFLSNPECLPDLALQFLVRSWLLLKELGEDSVLLHVGS